MSWIFFFLFSSSMFCLFFKIRHDFVKAQLHPQTIYFIVLTKRKHLSLSFFILFLSLPPLYNLFFLFFLLNPFKIDSTIAFILYCLRSYSVCFCKGYFRIQYATLGSLKLVYFSFRLISAYILISNFRLCALSLFIQYIHTSSFQI